MATRLDEKRITDLHTAMTEAAYGGPEPWAAWQATHDSPARLELAGGEIMNPDIRGFVGAWRMQGQITPVSIAPGDRFNANGLEGKVIVATTLVVALLVWAELSLYRCQIFTEATHE